MARFEETEEVNDSVKTTENVAEQNQPAPETIANQGEQVGTEQKGSDQAPAGEEIPAAPYSPEELTALIAEGKGVDMARLSNEGKAVWQTVQKTFTPKLQEAAELRKKYTELEQKTRQAPQPVPQNVKTQNQKTLEEIFDENPVNVYAFIDNEIIKEKRDNGGFDTERSLALDEKRRELDRRRISNQMQSESQRNAEQYQSSVAQGFEAQAMKEIPDILEKMPKIAEWALQSGYQPEELQWMVTPKSPEDAAMKVRLLKNLNSLYDIQNPQVSLKAREAKTAPAKVLPAGSGFETGHKEDKFGPAERRSLRERQMIS